MADLLFLPEAREDLRGIWYYLVGNASLARANAVLDHLNAACIRYADHPQLGEARHDLADEIRCFRSDSLVVFYVPVPNGIQVVRVIHGARNIPAEFPKHGK